MGGSFDVSVDVDELVREAEELRKKLAVTVVKLDAFTEQLQTNVDKLRQISSEIKGQGEGEDSG